MDKLGRPVAPWRVVLDTNVLISAYQFGDKPETILELAQNRAFVSLTSEPLRDELVRVLNEKFPMAPELIREACARFWEASAWVVPRLRICLCSDDADNRVLECAAEGQAGYIVTGDRDLLTLAPVPALTILTPDAFLAHFRAANPIP